MSVRSSALPGLAGKRILVTGGSRGIGRATAEFLAQAGASVGLSYRQAHREAEEAVRSLEEATKERDSESPTPEDDDATQPRMWAESGDLSREEQVERLFARVDREFGKLDGFVGSAGIWNVEELPVERIEPVEWHRMMAANLTSIYLTTRAAVARMGVGSRVVLLSSTAGQRGEAGHSHYAASKGAIISFCKSLATELGPRGITVNAVAPGWVDTDMSASILRTPDLKSVTEHIPLGRVATAEDVAGPICFLLSDLARHVTGEVLNVNGGSVLCG